MNEPQIEAKVLGLIVGALRLAAQTRVGVKVSESFRRVAAIYDEARRERQEQLSQSRRQSQLP